jgi:hypothetical protein
MYCTSYKKSIEPSQSEKNGKKRKTYKLKPMGQDGKQRHQRRPLAKYLEDKSPMCHEEA